jgi:hypothetical protein
VAEPMTNHSEWPCRIALRVLGGLLEMLALLLLREGWEYLALI